jgi:hypothetical protein
MIIPKLRLGSFEERPLYGNRWEGSVEHANGEDIDVILRTPADTSQIKGLYFILHGLYAAPNASRDQALECVANGYVAAMFKSPKKHAKGQALAGNAHAFAAVADAIPLGMTKKDRVAVFGSTARLPRRSIAHSLGGLVSVEGMRIMNTKLQIATHYAPACSESNMGLGQAVLRCGATIPELIRFGQEKPVSALYVAASGLFTALGRFDATKGESAELMRRASSKPAPSRTHKRLIVPNNDRMVPIGPLLAIAHHFDELWRIGDGHLDLLYKMHIVNEIIEEDEAHAARGKRPSPATRAAFAELPRAA